MISKIISPKISSRFNSILFKNRSCTFLILKKCYTDSKESSKSQNVYYGVLTPQIKAVKVFSLSTSIAGLIAQPLILTHTADAGLPVVLAVCSFVGFFTFVTPFLLNSITKKYVTHLDYNPLTNEYKATILTFFLKKKELVFKTTDVHVPDVPGMFTSCFVKGIPIFVDPRLFQNPDHYAKIMGFDKPIDLKLKTFKDTENK